NGRKEAALREWLTRRADRGAHLLGVCNGGRALAATGPLRGRPAPRAPRGGPTPRAARGAPLLGVCNGGRLLAATGLLDGRRATAHWSAIKGLERSRPQVGWVRGQRYVQDGTITTTAGVTSGVFGALRLVGQVAGGRGARRG